MTKKNVRQGKAAEARFLDRLSDRWIYLLLFLATIAVYARVVQFDFLNFDDPEYVADNAHLRSGITPEGIVWALTSGEGANWFPVTRLSHMLDWQMFGAESGMHHLTNALIHGGAALLLFAFLKRATQARWPSFFVALIFALHPLHTESVAWVSERKDVLCAFFWFLTLWAYVVYTEKPNLPRYLLVFCSFCLGLMSKPMIVTLPFVLLLIDVWPLRRFEQRKAVVEKMPLFGLSIAAAITTYLVQRNSGAVEELSRFPFGLRMENALVTYLIYIGKTFWPSGLAVFYPYPSHIPAIEVIGSCVVLAGVSYVVVRWFRPYPYLAIGWLWFLGTLVPVMGLVQVGAQARADRYMYVPMVGLCIMLVWGLREMWQKSAQTRIVFAGLGIAACVSCAAASSVQLEYWRNSESLFRHALAVTSRNYVAEHNLGVALAQAPGGLPEAIEHFEAALRINPHSARARTDLANALSQYPNRLPEAVAEYEAALHIEPDSAIVHNNLANTLSQIPGRLPEAISHYETALRLNPDYAEAHNNLGSAFAATPGHLQEAITEYETALRINPDYEQAKANLQAAISHNAEGHYQQAVALTKAGRFREAIAEYEAALQIRPDYAEAHNNLGLVLAQTPGRLKDAIAQFQAALRIKPDYSDAQYNLEIALHSKN